MKIKKHFVIDHIVLVLMVFLAVALMLNFRLPGLVFVLLFFVLPSSYLIYRNPQKPWKRILTASGLFGIIFSFGFTLFAEINQVWIFPPEAFNVLPKAIWFGYVPVEEMLWYFFWIFTITVYYEHFIDRDKDTKLSPRFKTALKLGLFGSSLITLLSVVRLSSLYTSYAYLKVGLAALFPTLLLFVRRPRLFLKLLLAAPYFILNFFAQEYVALSIKGWAFTGQYIHTVSFANQMLPVEELVFWIILSSTVILSYYELMVDDEK